MAQNKRKVMFVLRTSKMHGQDGQPQTIKINAMDHIETNGTKVDNQTCPFKLICDYLNCRKSHIDRNEQFFVFRDRSPVKPRHGRDMLKNLLQQNGLDASYYCFHCIRAGRALDMLDQNFALDVIKKIGRWRSTAVYAYLKS